MKFKKLISAISALAMLGGFAVAVPASAEETTPAATVVAAAQVRGNGGYENMNSSSNAVKTDVNADFEVNAGTYMGAYYQISIPKKNNAVVKSVTIDFDKVNNVEKYNRIIAVANPTTLDKSGIWSVVSAKMTTITNGDGIQLQQANGDWAETDITSLTDGAGIYSIFVYSSRTGNSTKYSVKNPTVKVTYEDLTLGVTTAAQVRGNGGYEKMNSNSNVVKENVDDSIEVNGSTYMGAYYRIAIPESENPGETIKSVTIDFTKSGQGVGDNNRIVAVANPTTLDKNGIWSVVSAKMTTITNGDGIILQRANGDWAETDITSLIDGAGIYSIFVYSTKTDSSYKYSVKSPVVKVTYKQSVASAVVGGETKYYDNLPEAVSAADENSTVTLYSDVTLASRLTISKNLTIASYGINTYYTITGDHDLAAILVHGNVTFDGVCITDSTPENGNALAVGSNNNTVTVIDGKITGNVYQENGTNTAINLQEVQVTGNVVTRKGNQADASSTSCKITIKESTVEGTVKYNSSVDSYTVDNFSEINKVEDTNIITVTAENLGKFKGTDGSTATAFYADLKDVTGSGISVTITPSDSSSEPKTQTEEITLTNANVILGIIAAGLYDAAATAVITVQ